MYHLLVEVAENIKARLELLVSTVRKPGAKTWCLILLSHCSVCSAHVRDLAKLLLLQFKANKVDDGWLQKFIEGASFEMLLHVVNSVGALFRSGMQRTAFSHNSCQSFASAHIELLLASVPNSFCSPSMVLIVSMTWFLTGIRTDWLFEVGIMLLQSEHVEIRENVSSTKINFRSIAFSTQVWRFFRKFDAVGKALYVAETNRFMILMDDSAIWSLLYLFKWKMFRRLPNSFAHIWGPCPAGYYVWAYIVFLQAAEAFCTLIDGNAVFLNPQIILWLLVDRYPFLQKFLQRYVDFDRVDHDQLFDACQANPYAEAVAIGIAHLDDIKHLMNIS